MTRSFLYRLISLSLRSLCAVLLLATLSACDRENTLASDAERKAATAGIVITTAADADALVPPLVATTAGKQVVDLLFDHLADPKDAQVRTDGDQGFAPRLARSWSWASDSLSIAFEIDSAARWHDGMPVTASDVRFSWRFYTDPAVGSMHARGFAGIDSVSVRDRHTAVVWWNHRHPEQFFQIAYNLAVMPEHLLGAIHVDSIASSAFASHPIGSGRYRFEQWDRKRQLVLSADSMNYRGRPTFDRVIWSIAPDPNAATAAILAGQADVLEVLRGDAVARAGLVPTLRTIEYGSLDYGYLVFNQRPSKQRVVAFADQPLRVALSAAVDRAAIVHNALDSLGRVALGPVTRSEATADTTVRPIAFDTVAAARTLDSLGWRWDAKKAVRLRDGKALAFNILVPASSGTRKKLAVLLQAQFARIGATVEIDAVESGVFAARLHAGDFDTALNAWRNDPSPTSIRQSWGSVRGDDVGANFGRYSSTTFDATVDSAIVTFDPRQRTALFRRAYQRIVDDAPAIWLYEPRNLAAIRTRLVPKGLRADAWLAGLADWDVQSVHAPATVARTSVP
ncbi:peptide ABC transporter substrate-binding protein [Gemmatimonas sp.]|uniref:peptide ABC transporter substrate-binding protein n=1 Tax=Gemmatimonas sp. TaxID=1962908 RepID=UPI003983032B